MPITDKGKKVLARMEKTYKSKEKAEEVFNAMINKNKKGSEKWHK